MLNSFQVGMTRFELATPRPTAVYSTGLSYIPNYTQNISNIKRMKGHSEAYRIRIEKYRLGFYFDGEVIELARFAKREDIYKLFP